MIAPGTVLYASADCDESLQEAREYIAKHQLTADRVRLIRKEGMILVIEKDVVND